MLQFKYYMFLYTTQRYCYRYSNYFYVACILLYHQMVAFNENSWVKFVNILTFKRRNSWIYYARNFTTVRSFTVMYDNLFTIIGFLLTKIFLKLFTYYLLNILFKYCLNLHTFRSNLMRKIVLTKEEVIFSNIYFERCTKDFKRNI